MAIGDAAVAAGLPIVSAITGKVKDGADEINRTRDEVAAVMGLVPASKASARIAAGISSGTADPVGGVDGDIYFKILP